MSTIFRRFDIDSQIGQVDDFAQSDSLEELMRIDTDPLLDLEFDVNAMNFEMTGGNNRPLKPARPPTKRTRSMPGFANSGFGFNSGTGVIDFNVPTARDQPLIPEEAVSNTQSDNFALQSHAMSFQQRERETSWDLFPTAGPQSENVQSRQDNDALSGHRENDLVRESRKHWSAFRCYHFDTESKCPKTAGCYLKDLMKTLANLQETATDWARINETESHSNSSFDSISERTRDKTLVFTQRLLKKATRIHRVRTDLKHPSETDVENEEFISLPSSRILEGFVQNYFRCFEPAYPSISFSRLDINALMSSTDHRPPTLLLLLMVALGSMKSDLSASQALGNGLSEVCRIGLIDISEQNMDSQWDINALMSALLFTLLAAWSGDKWRMDSATTQRGMYISILRQSQARESPPNSVSPDRRYGDADQEMAWRTWKAQETRNRLWSSWISVDLELSLFYELAPIFTINEILTVMPQDDNLWQASSATEWFQLRLETQLYSSNPSTVLRALIETSTVDHFPSLTPLQLRLFLYPIQTLIYNISQIRTCVGSSPTRPEEHAPYPHPRTRPLRPANRSRLDSRIAEVQSLLKHWHTLARHAGIYEASQDSTSSITSAQNTINLVLYHLISLNAITCFPCIERIKRASRSNRSRNSDNENRNNNTHTHTRHPSSSSTTTITSPTHRHPSTWTHSQRTHLLEEAEEAWFHSGQILRLLRTLSRSERPLWFAAAVYRAALVCWVNGCLTTTTTQDDSETQASPAGMERELLMLDGVGVDDVGLERYLRYGEGVPVVRDSKGEVREGADVEGVLGVWVELLEEGERDSFARGIRERLVAFGRA
ncbi:MAG: hypothetical protein Q9227_005744 [Pyrenula ochraceoflavens]